jgi:hypothetical protein
VRSVRSVVIALALAVCGVVMPPVVPGAFGFGMNTRAAYGGTEDPTIYLVTNLNDDLNPGSLRYGVEVLTGPRFIYFGVSGYIDLVDMLRINNPYISILGATAPGLVCLRRFGIELKTHDALLSHFAIMPGEWNLRRVDNCGFISYDNAWNYVLDHLTVAWGPDENIAISTYQHGPVYATIWRCLSGECLDFPVSVPASAGHAMLIQGGSRQVTLAQTLMSGCRERNPYVQGDCDVVIANNVAYDGFGPWYHLYANFALSNDPTGGPWKASVVGNVGIAGPHTVDTRDAPEFNLFEYNTGGGAPIGNQMYRSDNIWVNDSGVPFTEVINQLSYNPEVGSPPVSLAGHTIMDSADVEAFVLANCGARPAERDEVGTRIASDTAGRTSTYAPINSGGTGRVYLRHQDSVGGYPALASLSTTHTIPANPHTYSGEYTNLELWAQAFSETVEGGGAVVTPGDPVDGDTDGSPYGGSGGDSLPINTLVFSGFGDDGSYRFYSSAGIDLGQPPAHPSAGSGVYADCSGFATASDGGIFHLAYGDPDTSRTAHLFDDEFNTVAYAVMDAAGGGTSRSAAADGNGFVYWVVTGGLSGDVLFIEKTNAATGDTHSMFPAGLTMGSGGSSYPYGSIGVNQAGTKAYVAQQFSTAGTTVNVWEVNLSTGAATVFVSATITSFGPAIAPPQGILVLPDGSVVVGWGGSGRSSVGYPTRYSSAGAVLNTYNGLTGWYSFAQVTGIALAYDTGGEPISNTFYISYTDNTSTSFSGIRVSAITTSTGAAAASFVPDDGEFEFDGPFTALRHAITAVFVDPPVYAHPLPVPTPTAPLTPCPPQAQTDNGGKGKAGCNTGGIGATPSYSGPWGAVPDHPDPVQGETLTGKNGIGVEAWIEINHIDHPSGDVTQILRAKVPLADPSTYHGGYKTDGLLAVGNVEHAFGNERGGFEAATVDVRLFDKDPKTFRVLADTQEFEGDELFVKLASDEARV